MSAQRGEMRIDLPWHGKRVLVTGASGNLGTELARAIASGNTVYGSARFGDASAKAYLEAAGVIPVVHQLGRDALELLPEDIDYVFNFGAIVPTGATKTASTVDASAAQVAKVNALAVGEMMRRWPSTSVANPCHRKTTWRCLAAISASSRVWRRIRT